MPIYRHGNGIWYCDVTGPGGKRIRRSSGTKSKEQAQEWLARLEYDLWRQKSLGEKPRRTWNEAAVAYMKSKEETASYDQNRTRLRAVDPWLGGALLEDIDREAIHAIKTGLREGRKASTVNRYLGFVSSVLNYAADELEWLDRPPKVRLLPEEKPAVVFLEPSEVEALLDYCGKHHQRRHLVKFICFAIATGLRLRNVTRLRWNQIDMTQRLMWVEAADAKAGKPIPVPLTDDAIAVIRSQMGRHHERVLTYRGKPFDNVNPRTLKNAAIAAGIDKKVTAHTFRHTFASWHIMSGTTLVELKELGGWSKLESVLIYAHLSAEHLRSAAENRAQIRHTLDRVKEEASA